MWDFFRIGFYVCSKSPGITMEARGPQAQPHTHTQGAPGGNPDAHWQASGNLEPAVTVSAPAHWHFEPLGALSLSGGPSMAQAVSRGGSVLGALRGLARAGDSPVCAAPSRASFWQGPVQAPFWGTMRSCHETAVLVEMQPP